MVFRAGFTSGVYLDEVNMSIWYQYCVLVSVIIEGLYRSLLLKLKGLGSEQKNRIAALPFIQGCHNRRPMDLKHSHLI
jgi:hypothetical protein